MAVSPDGRRIVSGSDDQTVAVWDLESGKRLATLCIDRPVPSVTWHRDGRWILAGIPQEISTASSSANRESRRPGRTGRRLCRGLAYLSQFRESMEPGGRCIRSTLNSPSILARRLRARQTPFLAPSLPFSDKRPDYSTAEAQAARHGNSPTDTAARHRPPVWIRSTHRTHRSLRVRSSAFSIIRITCTSALLWTVAIKTSWT